MIIAYTAIITVWLPQYWLHPFGPVLKNLPILLLLWLLHQYGKETDMNTYLLLKWIHILSSVALVGVGFGSAFYMYFANRTRNVAAIAEVSRLVVRADYWFTAPTAIIQPVTGIALASIAGYPLTQGWLVATYALFILAGVCWLAVVWLQIRMAEMARIAADSHGEPAASLLALRRDLGTARHAGVPGDADCVRDDGVQADTLGAVMDDFYDAVNLHPHLALPAVQRLRLSII